MELVDGSKQLSKGKCPNVHIVLGDHTSIADLTVTHLLQDVELILGMNWLSEVNPVIDWPAHKMYLKGAKGFCCITGSHAPADVQPGTVKVLPEQLLHSPC